MDPCPIYDLNFLLLTGLLLFSGCQKEPSSEPQFNSFEEELEYLAEHYVRMGAAIGIVDRQQNIREYYFGRLSETRDGTPDSHSLFEIGSITKTFTATLLAQMILDSVSNYNARDIFQWAGFLKSSLHDMLIYLQAQMGLTQSSLHDAIALTHQIHFEVGKVTYDDREGSNDLSIGLAWHMDILSEVYTFYWHGGRTNGYMAYMGFDPESSTGVVILCNQSYVNAITRFGEDLLKAVNAYP